MKRNLKLAGLIGVIGILAACAAPLLAGQEPGVTRPSVLLRPGLLGSAVNPQSSAQKVQSGAGVGFVTIEGTRLGVFKTSFPGNRIPIMKFDYEVRSPRDTATGLASGKRQHQPIRIVKEWDASTPILFQALVTNEQIKNAKFEFVRQNAKGEEYVYHTIVLTNGAISNIKQFTGELSPATLELEEISFTFQKIEITNLTAKTTVTDELTSAR